MSPSGTPGRTPRALRSLAGATALAIAGVGLVAAPSAAVLPPDETTIELLSINDFHGRIARDGQAAGASVLACTLNEYQTANPNTLFVSAGDSVGASTFPSSVALDQPTLDVLNAMDLDVSAFGNHEFDKGQADLNDRIIPASSWPYVAANIYDATSGDRVYDPYVVQTVDGVDIGFIGGLTEEMPSLVSPDGIVGLEFRDLSTEVNMVAAQLSDDDPTNGEADVIVVLVHDGAATPVLTSADGTSYGELVANADANIDAIVSGHTHQVYVHDVGGMWVTQSAQYGEQMGHLSFTVDRSTGEITASAAQNIDLVSSAGVTRCTPDPTIQAIVDEALDDAKVLGAVPVGEITADLNRARHEVLNQVTGLMEVSENRGGESTIGNFIADVQLWAAQQAEADVAVINPGGIRANLTFLSSLGGEGDGVVTYEEAANVQSFANTIMVTTLTGAQLYTMLEQQWQPTGSSRPFLKLGVSDGLDYTYDPTAAAGSRVLEATLDGVPIDPAGTYTVAANSFLMAGGDNFTVFRDGSGTRDIGWVDLDAMVQFFTSSTYPVEPDYVQRAIGIDWVTDPDDAYMAGDQLAVNLSSLSFSTTEPKPATLNLTLGGLDMGTVPVDTAFVATTDEIGRANVSLTVPAGLDGVVDLVATDPATGTSITLEVTVTDATVVEQYVIQVYNDLLGRDPDPAGLQGWTAALLAGTPYAQVANGITYSDEYRSRLIAVAYQTYLGRDPDPTGAAGWLAAMRAGTTIQQMEAGFVASAEYYAAAGGTDADWVGVLYQDVLGRSAADAEVAAWTGALATGATRHQVAMGFLVSYEHLSQVVDGYYQQLLGRHAEPDGVHAWVIAIQSGVRVEAVIAGIVASDEYRNAV